MKNAPLKVKASETDEQNFLSTYGSIYEYSQWAAVGAWANHGCGTLDTVGGLHAAMMQTVSSAEEAQQMTLICAHPDLAQKLGIGDTLTAASTNEQTGAGLHACTEAEFNEFQALNSTYKTRFGFPFIIAVKGLNRQDILSSFRARINNDRPHEFRTALTEIDRIAYFRLCDLAEQKIEKTI